ncbi:type IV pilin protein [Vogesella sp. LIG4]|uniref:type IV pilin protein n=1 Tax=Vogesella sp. LIG4 TaxID=1192162 RepID=UPI00081F9E27|nr:type IV pilin protein [Vogesella sp. LIG4]SCK15149.1 type IV pilus assembly protein PilE [Vogesella sp. LIG4]
MKARGFSLQELVVCLVLTSLLAGWGISSYRQHVLQQELQAVAGRLKQCAAFLEEYYAVNFRYKESAYNWPALPYSRYPDTGNMKFQIGFGATARNTDNGYYALRAVDTADKRHYVELTQTGMLRHCYPEGSKTVCQLMH